MMTILEEIKAELIEQCVGLSVEGDVASYILHGEGLFWKGKMVNVIDNYVNEKMDNVESLSCSNKELEQMRELKKFIDSEPSVEVFSDVIQRVWYNAETPEEKADIKYILKQVSYLENRLKFELGEISTRSICTKRTNKLVDLYIQQLFDGKEVKIQDELYNSADEQLRHERTYELMNILVTRLKYEHQISDNQLRLNSDRGFISLLQPTRVKVV